MKKELEKHLGFLIFMVIWAALLAVFWLFIHSEDNSVAASGYSLLAFYVLLPASALVAAVIYGMGNSRLFLAFPVIAGVLSGLLGILTFDMAGSIVSGDWELWRKFDTTFFFFTFLPAMAGMAAGELFKKIRKKML